GQRRREARHGQDEGERAGGRRHRDDGALVTVRGDRRRRRGDGGALGRRERERDRGVEVRSRPLRQAMLRERLDELVATFDVSTISPDPLELARRYDDPLDQEVAGLIAAAFAYGRAEIIVANIGRVLSKMGPSPFAYLKGTGDRGRGTD